MHLFQGLLSYLNGEAGKYWSECYTAFFFFANQLKLLSFHTIWLTQEGDKIQRGYCPMKSNNIQSGDFSLAACLFWFSLDTSSSIDKSVPLEMPNQRSAAAQAQGIWWICFYTLQFFIILLPFFNTDCRFSFLWLTTNCLIL